MPEPKAACSWSSGKDSCHACYKAIKSGYKIAYLMNFVSQEFGRVSFHGVESGLVRMQAEAMGIPLLQKEVIKAEGAYEKVFREGLRYLKAEGVEHVIAGDIFLLDVQNWVEKICEEEGLKAVEPLWGVPSKDILTGFVDLGFKAVVTATKAELLGESWIGRIVDGSFIDDLEKVGGIDLCGENGEYHTFVFDGPIFNKRIGIRRTKKVLRNSHWFLDIGEYVLEPKGERYVLPIGG
jgi:uncharacterized protein (TIGR00290 family)